MPSRLKRRGKGKSPDHGSSFSPLSSSSMTARYLRRPLASITKTARLANANVEGSGTELRKRGEVPSPTNGCGGNGVPKGLPVSEVNKGDCHQESGKPEALACEKEAPEAVFQTST